MTADRQHAPASERNRQPILEVLQQVLPPRGTVLEIASGTGEHAAFFAPRLTHLQWLPTEPQAALQSSIRAWAKDCPSGNLLAPLQLDVSQYPWPVEIPPEDASTENYLLTAPITAIVNINMIHISPWSACEQLMAGAQRILPTDGVLYLYGPYRQANMPTAPSNEAFDQMLRDRNPAWGLRDLDAVRKVAIAHGLEHIKTVPMPANNLSVVFRKH